MDGFFKQKDEYFNALKNQTDNVVKLKQDLIHQVKEIVAQEDDLDKAKKIIEIQKQWKVSGSLPPKLDKKLWDEFKQVCDSFFKAMDEEKKVMKEQQNKDSNDKFAVIQKVHNELKVDEVRSLFQNYAETLVQSSSFTMKNDVLMDEKVFEWASNQKNREAVEAEVLTWYKQLLTKELLQNTEAKMVVKQWLNKSNENLSLLENNLAFFGKSNNPLLNTMRLNIDLLTKKIQTLQYVLKG